MCHEIDSEIVLANILKEKEECSFFDLITKKREIEAQLADVWVDVTKKSVFASIENHPNMFSWGNERIHKVAGSTLFESTYIDNYFNEDIEEEIRSTVITILTE